MLRPLPYASALLRRGRDGIGAASGAKSQSAAILMMALAILSFTLMDACANFLTQHYAPAQVIWARFALNTAIVLIVLNRKALPLIKTKKPGMHFLRVLTQIVSVTMFFSSLAYIGLANATAIMDINPVLVTLGAAIFLGEKIGIRRVLGIAAAMIGALIIIRPGAGLFHPAAFLPMIGACSFALGALLMRHLKDEAPVTSLLWSAFLGCALTSLVVPFFWTPIQMQHLWAFALLGIFGTISQYLLIRAFTIGEASVLAPFAYTGLVWAIVWDTVLFDNPPDFYTILGGTIIVGAGLYVWAREAQIAKKERYAAKG